MRRLTGESLVACRAVRVFDAGIPFGITSLIYQEVLQGVKSEKEFAAVKEYLDTQKFYSLRDVDNSRVPASPLQ